MTGREKFEQHVSTAREADVANQCLLNFRPARQPAAWFAPNGRARLESRVLAPVPSLSFLAEEGLERFRELNSGCLMSCQEGETASRLQGGSSKAAATGAEPRAKA